MIPAVRPQAVIFDWGGTLTPWHEVDLAEPWRRFARELHSDDDAAEALAARILDAEDRAWSRLRDSRASARMAEVLADAGIEHAHESVAPARAAYEAFWEPHTFTDPQVLPLWEGLRERGLRVGVLSNTIWTREYHRAIFERDGVDHLLDGDVYSSEVAWAKPHPEVFHAAAQAVDVDPAACVYIGDRIFEDVHGAQSAGMRAVLVPHSVIPASQQVDVDVTPDATIAQLLDLLDVIDNWS